MCRGCKRLQGIGAKFFCLLAGVEELELGVRNPTIAVIHGGRLRPVVMADDLDEARAGVDLVTEDLAKVTGLGSEDFLKDQRVGEPGKDVGNFAPCLAETQARRSR
jgi:hypothetical protein